jgi:hypothetical protein
MILYIRFVLDAHGSSSRPVGYLKGARLERSNGELKARSEDCRYWLEHTP